MYFHIINYYIYFDRQVHFFHLKIRVPTKITKNQGFVELSMA